MLGRLHILHVYKDYAPVLGGIENHVRVLAEAHAGRGHRVTVLVTNPGSGTRLSQESGVQVIRAARLTTVASTPVSPALALELRRQRPDVTHLHVPYPVAEAAWLAVGRPPLVITYHSDVVRQRLLGALWSPGLGRVLRRAAAVMATSPDYVRTSPALSPIADRVTIVPLGIRPERFEPTAELQAAARDTYGGGPTLVFVGRLRYYKGLDVLLRAMPQIPDARLLVAGGVGPQATEWQRLADGLGLADRVRWLGDVPDDTLPMVYAAGDVFVLPAVARSEAFGVVQLEAMAMGLPVVTTDLGTGTTYVTQHGETGLVVPPRQPRPLAEAIRTLLDDPERARRMGQAGRQRVLEHFTESQMIDAVEAVYQDVMRAPSR